jgi:hypothetical protein
VGDTFKGIQVGNIMPLQFESIGFNGGGIGYETTVRIIGMAYNPVSTKNKVELVVEEIV